jgi:hypothetical protein
MEEKKLTMKAAGRNAYFQPLVSYHTTMLEGSKREYYNCYLGKITSVMIHFL